MGWQKEAQGGPAALNVMLPWQAMEQRRTSCPGITQEGINRDAPAPLTRIVGACRSLAQHQQALCGEGIDDLVVPG
jgi:hypothetical protein